MTPAIPWLEEIEKRLREATPAPWYWMNPTALVAGHGHRPCILTASSHNRIPYLSECDSEGLLQRVDTGGPNAKLIAAAPTDLRRLLRACEVMREALERIADPVPSIGRPAFTVLDLRTIAIEALVQAEKMGGGDG